ncbi:hypothetical protein H8356DRAFT_1336896 [Neocallimastix lanati (nom. inval.)]|nr:hypothetical protein H8356DRAFT_1336896 [Neocallimastix sp. JGI-2020a]
MHTKELKGRLYEIELDIKKLKIQNEDSKLYLDNLNTTKQMRNQQRFTKNISKLSIVKEVTNYDKFEDKSISLKESQLFRGNILIITLYTNDEDLSTMYNSSINKINSCVNNIDLKTLTRSKLKEKHFYNKSDKSTSTFRFYQSSPFFNGYKYYITFNDDYVRKLIDFCKLMKNTTKNNINELLSDNAMLSYLLIPLQKAHDKNERTKRINQILDNCTKVVKFPMIYSINKEIDLSKVKDYMKKKKMELTFIESNQISEDPLNKSISGPYIKCFSDFIIEM